mgnify:CR=1 FL=1
MTIIDLDEYATIKLRLTDYCNYKCSYCIRRKTIEQEGCMLDDESCLKYIDDYNRIIDELKAKTSKPVKVDLIGGEVTILPYLSELITKLKADRINITTNLSRPIPIDPRLSVTASFHPEFTDLDTFFKAVDYYKDKFKNFKVETVSYGEATHVDAFIAKAKELGVAFMVEEDLLDANKIGKACSSNKPKPRYLVVENGSDRGKYYNTRNEFLKKHGTNGWGVLVTEEYCSRDVNYVYIEQGEVSSCTKLIPVGDFHVANFHKCYRGGGLCSLCGHITLLDSR